MSDAPKHRGRIQAQGDGLEESEAWSSENPPTWQEGLILLEKLKGKLSKKDRALRERPFKKAARFIKNAGTNEGVDAPVSKTFSKKEKPSIRVDIEVRKGIAFVSVIILIMTIIYWL